MENLYVSGMYYQLVHPCYSPSTSLPSALDQSMRDLHQLFSLENEQEQHQWHIISSHYTIDLGKLELARDLVTLQPIPSLLPHTFIATARLCSLLLFRVSLSTMDQVTSHKWKREPLTRDPSLTSQELNCHSIFHYSLYTPFTSRTIIPSQELRCDHTLKETQSK